MTLPAGTRLGPYEVLGSLGAGGMGEVYKAQDTRLGRLVAIKVLPAAFASDPDRLARFEREAKAVAALSHPNILAIFDTGVQETQAYVVTELLDGETLGERLQSGALPVRKAIELAVQIARGLAAAHAKGIVHRDLKPANVFLLADGQVKILDFGLAKPIPAGTDATAAPVTDPGSILGTVGYMAPEQVRGQAVDARTDLFAFGAVLYEMLTGQRAFKRDTAAETLTAILKDDPPELTGSRPDLSPTLERIVRHCLEKNPAERFQSARDVAFALETLSASPTSGAAHHAPDALVRATSGRRWLRLAATVIAVGTALGAGVMVGLRMSGPAAAPTFRAKTFQRQTINAARFMPDGRSIVFAAMEQGLVADLYVLRADAVEPQRIQGASGLFAVSRTGELAVLTSCANSGSSLFCSLARMSIGGAPRAVLEQVRMADWAPDGGSLAVVHVVDGKDRLEYPIGTTLYETAGTIAGVRVSPDGGRVAFFDQPVHGDNRGSLKVVDRSGQVTALTREFLNNWGLAWTPDGAAIVFTATERGDEQTGPIYVVAAHAGSPVRVLLASAGGLAVTDVAPDGAMLALRHEYRFGMVAMLPGALAERDVSWLDQSFGPILSVDGGSILFTDMGAATRYAGPSVSLRGTDGSPPQRLGEGIAEGLSPDGKLALAFVTGPPPRAVLYPTGPGEPIRLPNGPIEQHIQAGAWFPDGRRVLVCGTESGRAPRCYAQDVAGGAPKPVTPEGVIGQWVSPDGRRLLAQGSDGAWQVVALETGTGLPLAGSALATSSPAGVATAGRHSSRPSGGTCRRVSSAWI